MQVKVLYTMKEIQLLVLAAAATALFLILTYPENEKRNMPIAKIKEEKFTLHGVELTDPYKWLRDKAWPNISDDEILSYVRAENEFTEEFFKPKSDLVEVIFQEIKSKISVKDYTPPYQDGQYLYYSYILEKNQYWNHARKELTTAEDAKELSKQIAHEIEKESVGKDVFINENELAKNSKFFSLGDYEVSPSETMVAYSVDYKGDQRYDIVVKEIETGKVVDDLVKNTMGGVLWHQSSKGFFYVPANEFWRGQKVLYHEVGLDKPDVELFDEKDYTFHTDIAKSSSKDFLFIISKSSTTKEVKYLNLKDPEVTPEACKFIFARKEGHTFKVDHQGDYFYLLTNDKGDNFRLVKMPIGDNSSLDELLPHDQTIPLSNLYSYKNQLVLESRVKGLSKLSIYDVKEDDGTIKFREDFTFSEASYGINRTFTSFDSGTFRYRYSSLKTPSQVFEYDFKTSEKTKIKDIKLDGFNPDDYQIFYEEVSVPGVYFNEKISDKDNLYLRDKVKVPVTIIYKKSEEQGPRPLLLYGYGSYGITNQTAFRAKIFPLLDRGFAFAIAHIRGGGELGKRWYEAGKMLHKKNTFEDFIKVAEYLKDKGYASSVSISGGSAGGMLVGYCINTRPDLYSAAITQVPFVDVLNTMLDDSLPLTPGEFKEWGNPITNKTAFDYIKSYSPYDNIKQGDYPHLYITSGLYDQRVTYWEPLKFVAKLRPIMQDKILLLQMDMNAGHAGASGRFDYLYDYAKEVVFLLTALNKDS